MSRNIQRLSIIELFLLNFLERIYWRRKLVPYMFNGGIKFGKHDCHWIRRKSAKLSWNQINVSCMLWSAGILLKHKNNIVSLKLVQVVFPMSGMSAIIKAQAQIQCNWSDVYIRVSRCSKIGIAFNLKVGVWYHKEWCKIFCPNSYCFWGNVF